MGEFDSLGITTNMEMDIDGIMAKYESNNS